MIPGIDVSHYQGMIDWQQVATSGIKFAYLKSTEGTGYQDPRFEENCTLANRAGVLFGAYHFLTDADVSRQMSWFREISPVFTLPPVLDVEIPSAVGLVQAAIDLVLEWGVVPIVYTDPNCGKLIQGPGPSRLWIAEYGVHVPHIPSAWTEWLFWQWSDHGRVPGIEGDVDLDWFNGTEEQLQALVRKPT